MLVDHADPIIMKATADDFEVSSHSVARRSFDIVVAMTALVLLAPMLAGIALLITLTSRGGAIYRSERLALGGGRFHAYKFRTMQDDADRLLDDLLHADQELDEEYRRFLKLTADPRVTGVGKLLRRHSLDELPQLWNVLRGHMSIVGPRPKLPSEVEIYGPALPVVLSVRPGCTGLWQISGRSRVELHERIELDLQYVRSRSWSVDAAICLRTLTTMVRPDPKEAM